MDIKEWVDIPQDYSTKKFRKVIHLILLAISKNKNFCEKLVIKGGIVMSLVYESERHTTDLDITSMQGIKELTPEKLESDLMRYLKVAEIEVGYGLAFEIHSIKPQPKKYMDSSYPAYKVRLGFARQDNPQEMERLRRKAAHSIVEIDVSFNEPIAEEDTSSIKLAENCNILSYNLEQIVAEKYRSLLQQTIRNRNRRQDVYDIYYLLDVHKDHLKTNKSKSLVLNKLIKSSRNRNIEKYLHQNGILDEDIRQRSLQDFSTLALEIDISEIDPDSMFEEISKYFCSLPWENITSFDES